MGGVGFIALDYVRKTKSHTLARCRRERGLSVNKESEPRGRKSERSEEHEHALQWEKKEAQGTRPALLH